MNWTSNYFFDIADNLNNPIFSNDVINNINQNNNFLFIAKEDLENNNNSYNFNNIIDNELEKISINSKFGFDHNLINHKNDNNCWCCNNYIVIHHSNIDIFIKKYIYEEENNTKNKIKPSSLLIKILYRLHPEYFDNYDITKIKYINNLTKTYLYNDSYLFVYDNYFKDFHNDHNHINYFSCTTCKNNLCDKHMTFNPYYTSKCNYCDNYWNICIWCKSNKLIYFFDNNNKLCYEKSLCKICHNI